MTSMYRPILIADLDVIAAGVVDRPVGAPAVPSPLRRAHPGPVARAVRAVLDRRTCARPSLDVDAPEDRIDGAGPWCAGPALCRFGRHDLVLDRVPMMGLGSLDCVRMCGYGQTFIYRSGACRAWLVRAYGASFVTSGGTMARSPVGPPAELGTVLAHSQHLAKVSAARLWDVQPSMIEVSAVVDDFDRTRFERLR